MRCASVLVALAACHSSSSGPEADPASVAVVIEGHGVRLTPTPGIHATNLEGDVLLFGQPADQALVREIKNVVVKPGKPPTGALTPRRQGPLMVYADGSPDTTRVATGVDMDTYDGVLRGLSTSSRTGGWTIIAAGRRQDLPVGAQLEISIDGLDFHVTEKPPR